MLKLFHRSAVVFLFLSFSGLSKAATDYSNDFQKGLASYNLGDYQQALDFFERAIDDDPDSWKAYEQEGYCYFHLGKDERMEQAFYESLRLRPDNPELNAFMDGLPQQRKAGFGSAPGSSPNLTPIKGHGSKNKVLHSSVSKPNKVLGAYQPVEEKDSAWFKISGGFGYGALGDLTGAANLWNAEIARARVLGKASFSNFGYRVAVEGGLPLDKTNTLSVQTDFETGHGFEENLVYSSPVSQSINPNLFSFGLNYYHYFPSESNRFFLMGGILLGITLVDFYSDDLIETISGGMTGSSVGFTLGIGNEWKISPATGFELSGRFRVLSISQIQNKYLVTSYGNTGQVGLAKDPEGNLGVADTRDIGSGGLEYATIDFTGFTANFSFIFYLR